MLWLDLGVWGFFKCPRVFKTRGTTGLIPYSEPHLERGHIVIVDTKLNKRIRTDEWATALYKKMARAIKIVITMKLIAPFLDLWQWPFDSSQWENPVKKRHDSISSSFHTLSLSIFYTHANRPLICILMISLVLSSRLSDPSIKLSVPVFVQPSPFFCLGFFTKYSLLPKRDGVNQTLEAPVERCLSEQVYCAYITSVLW